MLDLNAAESATIGNPAINIAIFALFVVVTLAIVIRASRNNRSAAEYYAGGRAFTGRQNGILRLDSADHRRSTEPETCQPLRRELDVDRLVLRADQLNFADIIDLEQTSARLVGPRSIISAKFN